MLKQEIIDKITKYFKLTHYEAEKIYDDIFQSIMQGVKDDNITDVTNLGEFIVKYNENDNSDYKKTVEFLPSSNLEDEVSGTEEYKHDTENDTSLQQKQPELHETKFNTAEEPDKPEITGTDPGIVSEKPEEFLQKKEEEKPPESDFTSKPEDVESSSDLSVEDEIKRKREQIIHKLDPEHQEKYHPLLHVSEGINLDVPKPVVLKQPEIKNEMEVPDIKEPAEEEKSEEFNQVTDEAEDEVKDDVSMEKKEVDEITSKSFSDYFTEVKEEQKTRTESVKPETVIPPVAVDLHKEIVGEKPPVKPPPLSYQSVEPQQKMEKQAGNGYSSEVENKVNDNSYYIWYKDSEPNAVDTQTMSYEYELLYQATKEAEYKSKLRIYVTTFILFFSIVLILLIFSPVFYKYFFTPTADEKTKEQVIPEEESTTPPENNEPVTVTPPVQNNTPAQENKADVNPPVTNSGEQKQLTENNSSQQSEQKTNTPSTETTEQQKPETPATQQQKEPPLTRMNGVVKTGLGWIDEKNKVIYVQLDNGKYTIQESAWESNDKANKRITAVSAYNISGLQGNVLKVDLGDKGIWFRARFGEFTTIEEAKQKAEELREREKIKLQAFLMSILLLA